MGGYTAISDTGKTLVELLKRNCVPPVEKPELIGLCNPADTGNYAVCVSLYDIEEDFANVMNRAEIPIDETHIRQPPSAIILRYMIFTSLKSEAASKALDEQRILGRVFQVFADNRVLSDCLQGSLSDGEGSVSVTFDNISREDKIRVWSAFSLPMRTSLFYKVSGVSVSSERIREIKRVSQADFTLRQRRSGR